jgi:hypothetical protein
MRTSVLGPDPKARRNRLLVLTEEVCALTRFDCCRMLMQPGTRDLSFLLLLQEDGTIFPPYQGAVDVLKDIRHF